MSISSLHRRSLGRFSSKALFQISLIIQRSPIIQIEKTAFEKAYQKYFYEVEKELSRGPFKLSLGLLSEADSKTASTLQSNEPGQLSLEDADNAATSLIEQANSLPITDPNRNPSEKLFLVIKRPLFEFWEFPTIEYVDGSFETPLHKVFVGLLLVLRWQQTMQRPFLAVQSQIFMCLAMLHLISNRPPIRYFEFLYLDVLLSN